MTQTMYFQTVDRVSNLQPTEQARSFVQEKDYVRSRQKYASSQTIKDKG